MIQLQLGILQLFAEVQERFGNPDERGYGTTVFTLVDHEREYQHRRAYFASKGKGTQRATEARRENLRAANAKRWAVPAWKRAFANRSVSP